MTVFPEGATRVVASLGNPAMTARVRRGAAVEDAMYEIHYQHGAVHTERTGAACVHAWGEARDAHVEVRS